MEIGYFHWMAAETPTRFWINNPTGVEMEKAIAAGAINCTTNPAYCSRLLNSEPAYLQDIIDRVIFDGYSDQEAAVLVYQRASKRVLDRFYPLFQQSDGRYGYVTMQDDPREDHNTEAIVRCVLENRKLGPNYMAKIPVIQGGLEALEFCVEENVPICATEIFAVSQALHMCERYEQAARRTGNRPPIYVTHISGILDEYLGKFVRRQGIDIAPHILNQAGCAIARQEYRLLKERGYKTTMLGGGARGTHHFTEMVGGDAHVTINWSTAEEIMAAGTTVESRIDDDPAPEIIEELRAKLPDFARAYDEDGLTADEYASFGPVQLFRNAFLKGWYLLLAEVASRGHYHAL